MCGGRDFDNILLNEFVVPWLEENYFLPEGLPVSGFKVLSAKFFPNSKLLTPKRGLGGGGH